eukprot:m.14621 g.14621  ORF g.14621 m.14621 type:complete len:539 (-) comp3382_c0_seq1:133-1749(-)
MADAVLPTLSNEDQLTVFQLVKDGVEMDVAIDLVVAQSAMTPPSTADARRPSRGRMTRPPPKTVARSTSAPMLNLSNEEQIAVFQLVKEGVPVEQAIVSIQRNGVRGHHHPKVEQGVTSTANRMAVPKLNNEEQLAVFAMVKRGIALEEAVTRVLRHHAQRFNRGSSKKRNQPQPQQPQQQQQPPQGAQQASAVGMGMASSPRRAGTSPNLQLPTPPQRMRAQSGGPPPASSASAASGGLHVPRSQARPIRSASIDVSDSAQRPTSLPAALPRSTSAPPAAEPAKRISNPLPMQLEVAEPRGADATVPAEAATSLDFAIEAAWSAILAEVGDDDSFAEEDLSDAASSVASSDTHSPFSSPGYSRRMPQSPRLIPLSDPTPARDAGAEFALNPFHGDPSQGDTNPFETENHVKPKRQHSAPEPASLQHSVPVKQRSRSSSTQQQSLPTVPATSPPIPEPASLAVTAEVKQKIINKLRAEKIKLWLPPYTDAEGNAAVIPESLVQSVASEFGTDPAATAATLKAIQNQAVEKAARKKARA